MSEKEEIWIVRDPDGKLIGAGVGYWDATREARGNSLMGYAESERLCEGAERGSTVTVGPYGYSLTRLAALEARAEAGVTDAMREAGARALCLGFRMTHRDGDLYAPYDNCTEEGKNVWRGLANTTLHAALTGGASDGANKEGEG